MTVKKWFIETGKPVKNGDPICELEIDGETRVEQIWHHPEEQGGVLWSYVQLGGEVGPSGQLLEISWNTLRSNDPTKKIHTSARRPLHRRSRYPDIFISYRHVDTDAYAWRLHERLTTAMGEDGVFIDEFSILPGEVYEWTIQQAAAHCAAMVVLIGPTWMTIADEDGRRRIDNEADLLRREVCAALDRGTWVFPVLIGDAGRPTRQELPDDLVGLTQLQTPRLSARDWPERVRLLEKQLRDAVHEVQIS